MIARLSAWYLGLTLRERVLVSLAAALAALVLLVYGIVLPVGHGLDNAAERHDEVVQRSGHLMAALDQLAAPAPKASAATSGPVDQLVAASAQAAGFVLQSNQAQGDDAALVSIIGAPPRAALGWLDDLGAEGLSIEALTVTPSPEGTVSLNATIRRAGQ
ncbi:MAG: type II secretion system protein M [Sphingomonadales bacterium]|nr:type II secretion system protein M [Sphingomonadales bacterium]MDE2568138.1 type II secretion system protein M [Sphingomonadales bacterium]